MKKHIILSAPGNDIRFYDEYKSLEAAINVIKDYFGLYAKQVQVRYDNDENHEPCAFVNIWNRFFVVRDEASYESTKREAVTWSDEQSFRHRIMKKFIDRRFARCYRIGFLCDGNFVDKTSVIVRNVADDSDSDTEYGAIGELNSAKVILAGFMAKRYTEAFKGSSAIEWIIDSLTAQMDAIMDGLCKDPDGTPCEIRETFVPEPMSDAESDDTETFPLLFYPDDAVVRVEEIIKQYTDLLERLNSHRPNPEDNA